MKPEDTFRARVREARRARGFTQQSLGEACGMQRLAINHIEQGIRNTTLNEAFAIADALGVPLLRLTQEDKLHVIIT